MIQVNPPRVATVKDAVEHIMVTQSEQIVEAGKLLVARRALEFYAKGGIDDGANARIGLELSK